jgi:hypothetical protein
LASSMIVRLFCCKVQEGSLWYEEEEETGSEICSANATTVSRKRLYNKKNEMHFEPCHRSLFTTSKRLRPVVPCKPEATIFKVIIAGRHRV